MTAKEKAELRDRIARANLKLAKSPESCATCDGYRFVPIGPDGKLVDCPDCRGPSRLDQIAANVELIAEHHMGLEKRMRAIEIGLQRLIRALERSEV